MNFLHSLLERVPWFPTALAWAVALVILWLVASFPAYLLAHVIREVRLRIAAWLRGYTEGLSAAATKRAEHRRLAIERLRETRSLWIPRVASDVSAASKSLERLGRQIQRIQERLATQTIPSLNFPEVPAPERGVAESASSRLAWLYVVIGGLLLVALMVVNTGMLSQILRELAIVPAAIRLGDVPLYFVFAFLLSLVEAGIGFLHGALSHSDGAEGPKPLKVSTLGTLTAAIAIAFVEGFFYSQVGDPKRVFRLTEWLSARHDQIFFIWGAVLVMLLFGLGHVLIRSAQTIRSAGAVEHFRHQLKRIARDVYESKELFQETEQRFRSVTLEAARAAEAIQKTGITEVQKPGTPLSAADVESIRSRTNAWLAIALAGLLVLGLVAAMTAIPYWVGLGAGIASFVVGLLLRREDGAIQSGDRLTAVATWDWVRVAVAALVFLGVVILHIYLLRQLSVPGDIVGWLLSLIVCAVLIAAGREAAGAFAVFGVSFRGVTAALVAVASWLAIAFVYITILVVSLLETIFLILAAPVSWFRRSEPPTGAAPSEERKTEMEHAVVE